MQNDEADFEAWVDELDDSTRLAWLAFEIEWQPSTDTPLDDLVQS